MEYFFQEMPDLNNKGERLVYPKPRHVDQFDYEMFVDEVAQASGFNESQIRGVLDAVTRQMKYVFTHGYSVKIDGLGTFSPALGLKNPNKREEVKEEGVRYDTYNVYFKTVNFLPSKNWIKELRSSIELVKKGKTKTVSQKPDTLEDRLALAKEYLEKNAFMRAVDYARLTKQAPSSAWRDLQAFRNDPESGITTRGKGVSLIYVLREE